MSKSSIFGSPCSGSPDRDDDDDKKSKGYKVVYGTAGNDVFHALSVNEIIYGGGGNDTVYMGQNSKNVIFNGGAGNDTFVLDVSLLPVNHMYYGNDVFNGGRGSDTLVLNVTSQEAALLQSEILAFKAFVAHEALESHGHDHDHDSDDSFTFKLLHLTVSDVENIIVNITNQSHEVTAVADVATTISGNVLANDVDTVAMHVSQVNGSAALVGVVQHLQYGDLTINADGSYVFTPNAAAITLSANQVATYVETYQVTDASGNIGSASLTINLNGLNDAPTIVSSITTSLLIPQSSVTYSLDILVAGHAADVDQGDVVSVKSVVLNAAQTDPALQNLVWSLSGHSITLDETQALLAAIPVGTTEKVVFDVVVQDTYGATANATLTLDFQGTAIPVGADLTLSGHAVGNIDVTSPVSSDYASVMLEGAAGNDTVVGAVIGNMTFETSAGLPFSTNGLIGASFESNTLNGHDGNNHIVGDVFGNINVLGDNITVSLTVNGVGNTLIGGAGDDLIVGNVDGNIAVSGADFAVTMGGNTLTGGAGNNVLWGDISGSLTDTGAGLSVTYTGNTFVYNLASLSVLAPAHDTIMDFNNHALDNLQFTGVGNTNVASIVALSDVINNNGHAEIEIYDNASDAAAHNAAKIVATITLNNVAYVAQHVLSDVIDTSHHVVVS